jgi:hypothetical protein
MEALGHDWSVFCYAMVSVTHRQVSPVFFTAVNSPSRPSTSPDNGSAPRYATLLECMVSIRRSWFRAELMSSHEHGHRFLRSNIPGSCTGFARGHQIRAGCDGRHCHVSQVPVCWVLADYPSPEAHDNLVSYQRSKVNTVM